MAQVTEPLALDRTLQDVVDALQALDGVTQAKIVGALGYVPVSPTQLEEKQNKTQIGSITLSTNWTKVQQYSNYGEYTQIVTVNGATITSNSKVDLIADSATISTFIQYGVTALQVVNNAGVLTAIASGATFPNVDINISCCVTEVG